MQDCCGTRELKWTYDANEQVSLTTVLAEAIAEYKGMDPLDPDFSLYDCVDTAALDDFFTSVSGTELRTELQVAGVVVCLCKTPDEEIVVSVQHSET